MKKRIGTKLAVQMAIGLFIVITIFGFIEVRRQYQKYTAFLNEKEKNTLKPLVIVLDNLLFNIEREQIDTIIQSYLSSPDIFSIKILEKDAPSHYFGKLPDTGKIADFLHEKLPPPQYRNLFIQTENLIYMEHALGTLEVTFSRSLVQEEIRDTIMKLGTGFVLLILVETAMIILLVKRQVTLPLRYLTHAANQIAIGDMNLTFAGRISHNEIGVFTSAFQAVMTYIRDVTEIALRVSNGDLNYEFTPKSDKDALGQAFQHMSVYLREMASAATAIAEGDLHQDISPKNEHDVLGSAFQKMKSLRQSVSQIIGESHDLRTASYELTQISAQMASNAEQAAQRVQAVGSNSQQINQTVNEISTSAEELAASIREISQNIGTVKDIISSAVSMANAASGTIATLETHSREIGEIIKAITAITQQTNLLALNATIEAARAGDSGKGFAIVASEVKELARDIASSAETITERVETIQSSTNDAVKAIGKIAGITTQVHEISHAIASSIQEQSAIANEISRNILDTARGSDEITESIREVATVVQNSSQQANGVQRAAAALRVLADQLQHAVGRFKI